MYKSRQFNSTSPDDALKEYNKHIEKMFIESEMREANFAPDDETIEKCIKLITILKFQLKGNKLMKEENINKLEKELEIFINNNNITSDEKIKMIEVLCDMTGGAYTNDELVQIKNSLIINKDVSIY